MYLTVRKILCLLVCALLTQISKSQVTGDNCSAPATLTPNASCSSTSNTLYQATVGTPSSACGTTYDAWYSMAVPANAISITIDVNATGQSLSSSNTFFAIYSGSACSPTLVPGTVCTAAGTSLTVSTLTPATTYYVRVFTTIATTGSGTNSSKFAFTICATYTSPPSNDECSGAITLTSGAINSAGTIWGATASSSIPVGCATGSPDDDVWYKFTASTFDTSLTIDLSAVGTDLSTSGAKIQMFTGACGSLTSYACGTTTLTSNITGNTTYYIRVYSAVTGSIGTASSGSTFSITATATGPTVVTAGRMNEVYKQTILSGSGALQYPWEITYGPDDKLWITESRGYKVYRMDPNTGTKTTVLDLNSTSTDLTAWGADSLRAVNLTSTSNWNATANNWPQGGLAGLALHPKFLDGTGLYDFVYLSYVHRYLSTASGSAGIFFRNKIVRFTFDIGTGKLGSPAVVCDTIPGGQDHNSQRMIIAPVTPGGTYYLFYAAGDMGAGQYANRMRPMKAQNPDSYEGKILRFNLESDGDWIPNDNPYSATSAVWSIGIRNNQGFAYDSTLNILYGASHGPYSDDEINIIESHRNYGHPLIEGFVDGNYNGNSVAGTATSISAGAPYTDNLGVSSCPPIGNEDSSRTVINSNGNGLYKDPLFSAYAVSQATVANIWKTNPGNALPAPGWPTESWSGLDLYTKTYIPGWKNSLVAASLKWGRLVKLRLDATGTATAPTNTVSDTVSYFGSQNRFRDLAFSPDGKDIFVVMDNNSTTSGPGSANPVVPSCAGCVQKYTFLGYNNSGSNRSTIPTSIDITSGTANTTKNGTTVTIDASNNTIWVPITGPDGNIMAEIKANGNNLGTITSSFYNSGSVREDASKRLYLNRSMTITPQNQPSSTVNVRLYITNAELSSLMSATNSQGTSSGVSSVSDLKVLKNADATPVALTAAAGTITPAYAEAFPGTTNGGYVLEADINSFSSFYFGNPSMITLPLELLSFKGSLKDNAAFLQWETSNESNTSHFLVERSIDGQNFETIGTVAAGGNTSGAKYSYTDWDADKQSSSNIYYRLKMIDRDAAFKQSQMISVSIKSAIPVVTVYPNPVNDVLNLRLTLAGTDHIHIQVTDMQGRVMYKKIKLVRGSEDININTKSWPSQSYSIIVSDSNRKILISKKLIKI